MKVYQHSRRMIISLRALMNIVHFGAYVDEGMKQFKNEKVQHRSALLEVINESERIIKQKKSLLIEYEPGGFWGAKVFYTNEPYWRS